MWNVNVYTWIIEFGLCFSILELLEMPEMGSDNSTRLRRRLWFKCCEAFPAFWVCLTWPVVFVHGQLSHGSMVLKRPARLGQQALYIMRDWFWMAHRSLMRQVFNFSGHNCREAHTFEVVMARSWQRYPKLTINMQLLALFKVIFYFPSIYIYMCVWYVKIILSYLL